MADQTPSNQEAPQEQAPEELPEAPQEGQEAPDQESEGQEGQESAGAQSPDAEEGESEGEAEEPAAAPEGKKPSRPGSNGYKRRIDRLERQLSQALEVNARFLSGAPQQPPPQPDAKPKTDAEKAAEQFRAMMRQEAQAILAHEREQAEQQRHLAELRKQEAAARAVHPDFQEAMDDVAHIPVSDHLRHAILTSENKAEIMYALAKNPAELARISALPPLVAAREVGKLEAKVASGAAPQKPKPSSRPPPPPSRVGGKAPSSRNLDDLPLSEYKRAKRSNGA